MRAIYALCLLALLAAAPVARAARLDAGANPEPGPGCSMIKDKSDCKHSKDGCVWCSGTFAAACYSEDQAKFLPSAFFHCKPKPSSADAEPAPLTAAAAGTPEGAAALVVEKGGGGKADCKDEDARKGCIKSKAVCSWCENKYGPAMCVDEAQAKFLPPMVYDCEKSRRDPDAKLAVGEEDEDEEDEAALVGRKHKKHDDDDKAACRDEDARKGCVKSKAVCSWCENKYGPAMCLEEAQAKFLPPMVFDCEKSRRGADAKLAAAADDEDEDADEDEDEEEALVGKKHKKHDDDKADCKDEVARKGCVKSKAVCSWCENKYGGPTMCMDEAQAKFLPPMVFDCEKSRRDPDAKLAATADDEDEEEDEEEEEALAVNKGGGGGGKADCKDEDARKGCIKSKAVCSWCESKYGGPAMCMDEAQAKFLPPMAFDCEKSRRDPKEGRAGLSAAAAGTPEEAAALVGRKHKKHDDDDKKTCRDEGSRKGCVKSKAVCSWCEGAFVPAMCLDEAQAKFLPPMVFTCKQSRRAEGALAQSEDAGDDDEAEAGWSLLGMLDGALSKIVAPFAPRGPLPGPTDKCTDVDSRKKCGKAGGCRWCEGQWTAGQCFSEERAKMLPSSMFTCEAATAAPKISVS
ncbi:MAG: hypothetical protein J3K34DRAFT_523151 [Monoraphidium minutum]|nr:MAG: hypothetical protein J3K34DRAFT_523151 [Monoraphidium minutum]